MSGSTSGTLIGAVSTWKPFGGGGATTTSFGMGFGSSLGGGGSFFFMSTNSTFSAFGFSDRVLRLQRAVHGSRAEHRVQQAAEDEAARRPLLLRLGLDQVVEHVLANLPLAKGRDTLHLSGT